MDSQKEKSWSNKYSGLSFREHPVLAIGLLLFVIFIFYAGGTSHSSQNNQSNANATSPSSSSMPAASKNTVTSFGGLSNVAGKASAQENATASTPPLQQNTNPQQGITASSASNNAPVPSTAPVPTPPPPTPPDYSTFQAIDFDQYRDDFNAYKGSNIAIVGMLDNAFLPAAYAYMSNFVEMIDPADPSQPKMEIEIDDNKDYSTAVNGLQPDTPTNPSGVVFVKVYGTGVPAQQFTLSNGSLSYIPTISAERIDRCTKGYLSGMIVSGSTLADMFQCSSWKTIFQE